MSYAVINYKENKGLGFVKAEQILDEVIIQVPKFKKEKTKKYSKKVIKMLKKYNTSNIVLNEDLQLNEEFKNILYENNNYIITGKRLYKVLILTILKDISKQMELNFESVNISILVDEYSIENIDLIEHIAKEVKTLTVVTSNMARFEKIYEKLFEKYGIILRILEKGRNNLKRSQYVINIDFTYNDIKQLTLAKNAVCLSINEKIGELKKGFNGIIINDIDIYINKECKNFRTLSLCEAYLYNYLKKIKDNENIFEKSEYKINGYYGNKGNVIGEEFKRLGKTYVKKK